MLYEDGEFDGRSVEFGLGGYEWIGDEFNDKISSLVVQGDCWATLWQDRSFQGWSVVFQGPGSWNLDQFVTAGAMNDDVSSLQLARAHDPTPSPTPTSAPVSELESSFCAKQARAHMAQCIPCSRFGMDSDQGCTRDSTVIASMIFTPWHTCGANGECGSFRGASVCRRGFGPSAGSCWLYNRGQFVPHDGIEGHCFPLHMKAYAEHNIAAGGPRADWFKGGYQWSHDIRKGYDDGCPGGSCSLRCADDSFCRGYGAASGDVGDCSCACTREAVEQGKHDRCTTIPADMCTDEIWCSGGGTAIKSGEGDQVGCSCSCGAGHSGARCQKREGDVCDWTDCNGHGWPASQNETRGNCNCDCVCWHGDECGSRG